ncbi:hypothetical protein THAOC_26382, partial [Thalassiosira oceanica]
KPDPKVSQGTDGGRGTLVVAGESGYTYTGTFRNGEFHGSGTIASRDGSIYQGQFEKGAYHGVGVLRTASAAGGESVYAGDFFPVRAVGRSDALSGTPLAAKKSFRETRTMPAPIIRNRPDGAT